MGKRLAKGAGGDNDLGGRRFYPEGADLCRLAETIFVECLNCPVVNQVVGKSKGICGLGWIQEGLGCAEYILPHVLRII